MDGELTSGLSAMACGVLDAFGTRDALGELGVVGGAIDLLGAAGRSTAATLWGEDGYGRFIGRMHPIAVHFPIALLIVAAIVETCRLPFSKARRPSGFGLVAVIFAAFFATWAAGSGWLNADFESHEETRTLTLHRWLGVGVAAISVVIGLAAILAAVVKDPETSVDTSRSARGARGEASQAAVGSGAAGVAAAAAPPSAVDAGGERGSRASGPAGGPAADRAGESATGHAGDPAEVRGGDGARGDASPTTIGDRSERTAGGADGASGVGGDPTRGDRSDRRGSVGPAFGAGPASVPSARRSRPRRAFAIYRYGLLISGVLVAFTGHLGGELVYGEGYLMKAWPSRPASDGGSGGATDESTGGRADSDPTNASDAESDSGVDSDSESSSRGSSDSSLDSGSESDSGFESESESKSKSESESESESKTKARAEKADGADSVQSDARDGGGGSNANGSDGVEGPAGAETGDGNATGGDGGKGGNGEDPADTTAFDRDEQAMAAADPRAFFATAVLPPMQARCVECHGPDKAKAGLRLDSFEATIAGDEFDRVVVPGDPKESILLQRVILPRDHIDAMPPKGEGMTDAEIESLRAWIAALPNP